VPAFKKQQFSKVGRQGEQVKVTAVSECREVRRESIEITAEIVQSFETSQTTHLQLVSCHQGL
jgi:hypothetical protein